MGGGLSAPADTHTEEEEEAKERSEELTETSKSERWRRSSFAPAGKTFRFTEIDFNVYLQLSLLFVIFQNIFSAFLGFTSQKAEYQIVLQVMDIFTVRWCFIDHIKKIIMS